MARASVRKVWPARVLILICLLGLAATLFADWPGHFPPDAIYQLAQGRAGVFNLWHPPAMAWLLGLADRLSPSAAAFFVIDAALFFAAMAALALLGEGAWLAVLATALVAASPLILIYQGMVLKDVFFADVSLGAFAAIAWAARLWRKEAGRGILILVALVLLTAAVLARQNGAAVAVVGAFTLAAIAAAHSPRVARVGVFIIGGLAALLPLGAAVWLATAWFARHSDHQPERARQWMALEVYDLAGAVHRDPALPMPVLGAHAPSLEHYIRDVAAPRYDPARIDPILRAPGWNQRLKHPSPWAWTQWRRFMTASPKLYLKTRWAAFWQVLATPKIAACAPVLVGVDPGDPRMLRAAGLSARETDQDDWDGDYAASFLGTPVFSHLAYAAAALVLLALAIRDAARGRVELIATAGLLTAALVYAASFFLISLACDYRYLYFVDVAAMAALVQRLALRRPAD
jgi:hypothetical protein